MPDSPQKNILISVVITVLNEANSIEALVDGLYAQSKLPSEIIFVDGGSTDSTVSLLNQAQKKYATALVAKTKQLQTKHPKIKQPNTPQCSFKIFSHPGNISQGRNYGILQAKQDWIACTDAGCVPKKNWLEELQKPLLKNVKQKSPKITPDVVAGYYFGLATSPFEHAVIPFVLVQPDVFSEDTFLPATRSILFHKSVWKKICGFREDLLVSEDYYFAKQIKKNSFMLAVAPKALVGWKPRSTLQAFVRMVYGHARYDELGGVRRLKVSLIFLRYLIGSLLLFSSTVTQSLLGFTLAGILVTLYLFWSILKHKNHFPKKGWYYLPLLQISSDVAVMLGTISGLRAKYSK